MNVLRMYQQGKSMSGLNNAAVDDDDSYLDAIHEQEAVRMTRAGVRRSRMMRHDNQM